MAPYGLRSSTGGIRTNHPSTWGSGGRKMNGSARLQICFSREIRELFYVSPHSALYVEREGGYVSRCNTHEASTFYFEMQHHKGWQNILVWHHFQQLLWLRFFILNKKFLVSSYFFGRASAIGPVSHTKSWQAKPPASVGHSLGAGQSPKGPRELTCDSTRTGRASHLGRRNV